MTPTLRKATVLLLCSLRILLRYCNVSRNLFGAVLI